MVNRSSYHPRLPRKYWGELIYATPGCGKTYVADKYRDVVDGDNMIVEAIGEVNPGFIHGYYDDPRFVIFRFFRYINFNRRIMWKVYNAAMRKMRYACQLGDVVLFGTMDLISWADRIFLAKNHHCVRNGFHHKQYREEEIAYDSNAPVHHIYEFLDNSLQRECNN